MEIKISKKGFKCAYCGEKRKGAYKIVDGVKSCEKCNRAYDYIPSNSEVNIYCPLCGTYVKFSEIENRLNR